MKVLGDEPTTVFVDNTSTIKIPRDDGARHTTKHIDTRAHWLQEKCERGIISLQHISTKKQAADMFTKPFPSKKFEKNRKITMMMAVLSVLALFSGAECFEFVRSDPVYYTKTNINYVTGEHSFRMMIHIPNACRVYFNSTPQDPAFNKQTLNICNTWFEQDTTGSMYVCKKMDIFQSSMMMRKPSKN